MMIRKNSLSFRIIIRVLVIAILLFIFILSGYHTYTRNIIRQKTRENAIQMAGNIAGKIEQQLGAMEKIPEMIGATLELGVLDPDSVISVLQNILETTLDVAGACVAFEPGFLHNRPFYMPYAYRENNVVKSTFLGSPSYEYYYMDWYQIPRMLEKPYWSEPYYDEGGGNILMATYSVPFYMPSPAGRHIAGIATVDIGLEWLTDIVSREHIFESGYTFLLSRNGMAVTHPDKSMIMNESIYSNSINWGEPLLREIGRDLRKGISKFRKYNLKDKPKRWIYYTNLPSGTWSIAVVYPDREMYASLKRMNLFVITLFGAGLILLTISTIRVVNLQTAPLDQVTLSARQIAQGNFNVEIPVFKSNFEMEELRNAFCHMQKELEIYIENLQITTSAKEKIESELRIARDIQMSMIPHTFPPFPDLPQIDLFAQLKSAKEVGGDLYDFFMIGQKKFCFAIGDVSGKGVPASLFMAVTRTLLRSIADKQKESVSIMKILNKSLALNNDSSMFVTFFCGILDLEDGQLYYTNAGHNPPVILRKDGIVETLPVIPAIPLGLQEDYMFTESSTILGKGDKIFAYTDGVSEAENMSKQLFGENAIIEVLSKTCHADPQQLIKLMEDALEIHVAGYEQSDDITMMAITFNG